MPITKVRLKLAKRLRQLRVEKKLTQEKAAELIGLDLRNYQRMESQKPRATRIDTLDRIAEAFDIPLWKLLKF
jgi:transcriptional regulator with XRE-family HTH domain